MSKSINVLMHRVAVRPMSIDDWDENRRKMKELGFALAPVDTLGADKSRLELNVDIGEVLQIGATAYKDFNIDVPVKVGDIVAYVKSSGKLVKNPFTDEKVLCLNDEDIVAILTKE